MPKPGAKTALQKARDEDKLIFLSVGYSACHWCHVMEKESFENDEIAAYLNEHYVSIKVDRERRPDLDEQFLLATQVLTGSSGWPNTVFLTPEGDPFHGGTYFPPDAFMDLLHQIVALRARAPAEIIAEGELLSQLLVTLLHLKAKARDLTPELINGVARAALSDVDFFYGGIGVTSKFPRETLFLFLLDQAMRTGDTELLDAVTTMLDGMIIGGIHDQVGGGFHRYAVDPQWHIPHFEKMLFTQAMTGRLLVRAWQASGKPSYRRAAERLFAHVLRDMRDDRGGFYSALNADSNNAEGEYLEGVFYTWTPEQMAQFSPEGQFLIELFQITEDGELEGENVQHWPDFAETIAQDMGLEEAGLYARLDPLLEQMLKLRNARPTPLLDRKIVTDWNAAMIETLAEAAHVFERPDYLKYAGQAAEFILENMSAQTGLYRIYYDANPHITGQLSDHAAMGLALVALHDYTSDPVRKTHWLQQAEAMAAHIRATFGKAEDAYRMTAEIQGVSAIVPLEDGELASGNALALDLFARLAKRRPNPELELEAIRLAAALSGHAIESPRQMAAILTASQELQFGETGPVRYIAGGAVRIEKFWDRAGETVRFQLDVAPGWHVNAHKPLEDFYIPMELSIAGRPADAAAFPPAIVKSLGFNALPLALYEGAFSVQVPARSGVAVLSLQACSDEVCLQPEELRFQLW